MARMNETQIWIAGALIGAGVGAAVAYLYATDNGARRRDVISRAIDRLTVDAEEAKQLWFRLNDAWTQYEKARARPASRVVSTGTWPPRSGA